MAARMRLEPPSPLRAGFSRPTKQAEQRLDRGSPVERGGSAHDTLVRARAPLHALADAVEVRLHVEEDPRCLVLNDPLRLEGEFSALGVVEGALQFVVDGVEVGAVPEARLGGEIGGQYAQVPVLEVRTLPEQVEAAGL